MTRDWMICFASRICQRKRSLTNFLSSPSSRVRKMTPTHLYRREVRIELRLDLRDRAVVQLWWDWDEVYTRHDTSSYTHQRKYERSQNGYRAIRKVRSWSAWGYPSKYPRFKDEKWKWNDHHGTYPKGLTWLLINYNAIKVVMSSDRRAPKKQDKTASWYVRRSGR